MRFQMLAAVSAAVMLGAAAVPGQGIQLRHPLDNQPVELPLPEGDKLTQAVETFHATGENPYVGDAKATAEGRKVYTEWCQACHMPSGGGGMGPSLIDQEWRYPRTPTTAGKFEIIWFGASGAMQPFKDRLTQDQVLQVIAYVEHLREAAGAAQQQVQQPTAK